MFGSDGVQPIRRIAEIPYCLDRSGKRLPLRSEHFPVQLRGHEIVTQHGVVIAVAADTAMGEEKRVA